MSDILITIFGRLFESDLGSVEELRVSTRTADGAGVRTLDTLAALAGLLGEETHPESAPDPLHVALLKVFPAWTAAVSGVAPHLRDLLAEGMAMPDTTSMMRKRAVPDLNAHLVAADALAPANLVGTLSRARERCEAVAAKHVLLITPDGTVHVAGRTPEETMAHWSNVEFAARVGIKRIEERLVHAAG